MMDYEQLVTEMYDRFIKRHMDCGATLEQAQAARQSALESLIQGLEQGAEANPDTRSDEEIEAEYEREHEQHTAMLRAKYAAMNGGK